MAIASGTLTKDITGGGWAYLKILWEVTEQTGNTSAVTVRGVLQTDGGPINTSVLKSWSASINGNTYTGQTSTKMLNYQTRYIFTRSLSIAHNADGTKTIPLSFTIGINATLSGKVYNDVTVSGNVTLPIIHATSTFTRSGTATMGYAQTITITRKNSSYTHILKYTFAGKTEQIASNIGTSYTWTPTVAKFAPMIPNAPSATCTLTLETWYNGGKVGTKTLSFTLSVPSSVVPTISAFTLAEAVSGLAAQFGGLKGSGVDYGAFLNSKSKIKYSVTAAGAQGSTIKTYSISIIGQKFAKSSATTAVIAASYAGTHYATVTVTDTRGRKATLQKTLTVVAYAPPKFTTLSINRYRYNAESESYELDESGECAGLRLNFSIAESGGKNEPHTCAIEYKLNEEDESEYKALPFDFTAYAYNGTLYYSDPVFSKNITYNIRVTLTDYFGSIEKTVTLSSSRPVLDIMYSGSGIAFNKMAEVADLFDCGYQLRFWNGFSGMPIYAGQDFDELLTPNFYQSAVTPANGGFKNCPINDDVAFLLEVLPTGNNGQVLQRLTVCSKQYSRVYERHYYLSTWGDWFVTFDARGKLLWSGVYYMNANQKVTLAEPISKQPHGIMLTFSRYNTENSTAENWGYVHHFVDKYFVANEALGGSVFTMNTNGFGAIASKYLYFTDTEITGHDGNDDNGTANGITYNNKLFVLRSVKGI